MSKIDVIFTSGAPAAIGAYSQGKRWGGLVFTSGQIPIDPVSGAVVGKNIEEQSAQVLKNLLAVLEAGGSGAECVLKTTCFLADIADFAAFNAVYAAFFTQNPPARSCVAVKTLPKNVLVEVEAIGVVREGK